MIKEKVRPLHNTEESIQGKRQLVLYNDDFNTFDFVIETLIELCGHDNLQAEQCTLIVHYKGYCTVKTGSYNELRPIYEEMLNRTLTASIK